MISQTCTEYVLTHILTCLLKLVELFKNKYVLKKKKNVLLTREAAFAVITVCSNPSMFQHCLHKHMALRGRSTFFCLHFTQIKGFCFQPCLLPWLWYHETSELNIVPPSPNCIVVGKYPHQNIEQSPSHCSYIELKW